MGETGVSESGVSETGLSEVGVGEVSGAPKGAAAMTAHLDLLTDEPLALAAALRNLAERRAGAGDVAVQAHLEWTKFAEAATDLVRTLEALNEPGWLNEPGSAA